MKSFIIGLLLLAGFGCTNLQPMGPLSKQKTPATEIDADIPPPPSETSPKHVPPAMTIVPGEVNSGNASAAVRKLTTEFEFDWSTIPPPSKTVEVSRYKNGVKVN